MTGQGLPGARDQPPSIYPMAIPGHPQKKSCLQRSRFWDAAIQSHINQLCECVVTLRCERCVQSSARENLEPTLGHRHVCAGPLMKRRQSDMDASAVRVIYILLLNTNYSETSPGQSIGICNDSTAAPRSAWVHRSAPR